MITYNTDIPVLLLIFNRPDTTSRVFSQIRKARPGKLYVAADGPRFPEEKTVCDQVRKMAIAVDWDCEVRTLFREKNLGCGTAISQAINWFFEHEPEGIILEDDCLPADSFFGFCSSMLEKYRDDARIGHINGSNYQSGAVRGDGSYYFSTLTHVWGWAGWRRVWKDFDLKIESYPLFEKMNCIDHMSAHAPFKSYWNYYFRLHYERKADSWGFQYSYLNLINRRLSVIPNVNLITNTGCSNKPTHFIQDHPFADIPLSEMDCIVHPSFFVADVEADIQSQNLELRIPSTLPCKNSFSFIKEKLISMAAGKNSGMRIPRIIHQVYFDPAGLPEHLAVFSQTWKETMSGWEYRFWDGKAVEQLMESEFRALIPLFRSFPLDVQRWDFSRYLILYRYGGLYADLDYICLEPLDTLLWNSSCCFGMEPTAHAIRNGKPFIIGNALMASVPGHGFWTQIFNDISQYKWQRHKHKGLQVIESTGPYMISRVYEACETKDEITLIPAGLVAPLSLEEVQDVIEKKITKEMEDKVDSAFALHYFLGSWYPQVENDI